MRHSRPLFAVIPIKTGIQPSNNCLLPFTVIPAFLPVIPVKTGIQYNQYIDSLTSKPRMLNT